MGFEQGFVGVIDGGVRYGDPKSGMLRKSYRSEMLSTCAYEANPNLCGAFTYAAIGVMVSGILSEGLKPAEKSLELDPDSLIRGVKNCKNSRCYALTPLYIRRQKWISLSSTSWQPSSAASLTSSAASSMPWVLSSSGPALTLVSNH